MQTKRRELQSLGSLLMVILPLLLYSVLGVSGQPQKTITQTTVKWTIMVYIAGDNDLEEYAIADVNEMETVGSTADVNIVVQFDRTPRGPSDGSGYDDSNGNWTTTRRYYITQDSDTSTIGSELKADLGEKNMGDPQTLIDFVDWATTHYTATDYALILWDHGSGWKPRVVEDEPIKSVCIDETDNDRLTMPELKTALSSVTNNGASPLSLVGFDACLMAMIEVDNQVKPYASVRVGSEETEPGDGWPYDTILAALTSSPDMTASQLGILIVDEYYASYGNDQTQSAVHLSSDYDTLNTVVDDFAQVLVNNVSKYHSQVMEARNASQSYAYDYYIDLYDFIHEIDSRVSDTGVNNAAQAVINAVTGAVIREKHGTAWPDSHGITIYFPRTWSAYLTDYDGSQNYLEFTKNTHWDEWLHAYYFHIIEPHQGSPAYAGSHGSPNKITVEMTSKESGLNRNDFVVNVGGKVASVLTCVEAADEYILEVMPPSQASDGLYDIIVAVGAESDTEAGAVQYTDTSNVDVALVLDRSGSMSGQKIADAKAAAQQFVDLMMDGDMVGVASYSSYATVNYPLTTIAGIVKTEAKNAIASISSGGMTSIGDGLQTGQDQLTTSGQATHPWAIVLLSDGLENTAPYIADVLPGIVASKTFVHTIGLGSDADEALMMDIATQTGGTYHFAFSSEVLAGIYNTIAGAVSGQQTLLSFTGTAQQGVTDEHDVVVDSTVSEATFSINWSNSSSDLALTLRKPNGQIIDPTVAASDPNVDYVSGSTYEYYRVRAPVLVAGVWTMQVTGGYIPLGFRVSAPAGSNELYTGLVTGRANLTLHTYLDRSAYLTYEPVRISVSLSDNQPITGASVTVTVRHPSGASTTVTLYDDGAHDDGGANDGVYAQTYVGTTEGTYTFLTQASGTSNTGESFTRGEEVSTYIARNPHPPHQVYLPLVLRCSAPTWSSTTGLSARTVYALTPDPTNCHTRYAGADDGVYKSTDTGNTWAATGLNWPLITSVAVDPAASQTIYAATWGQGVYKSSNGGTLWSQVNSGLGDELWLYALVLAPDGSLYAGTYDGGVYKSTSGGASWSPVNNGLGDFNIRALAADPNNSQVVYAGTTDGVYKTTNGGASWSATGSGLAGQTVWVLGVHPTSSATIFAGTDNGLYRSTDGGGTWAQVGLAGQRLYAVVVDPLDGQRVYAGSDGGGVYRSTDGGATWTAMNTGLGNLNVQSLALDGGTCHALQTGTEDGVWSYSE